MAVALLACLGDAAGARGQILGSSLKGRPVGARPLPRAGDSLAHRLPLGQAIVRQPKAAQLWVSLNDPLQQVGWQQAALRAQRWEH
jgi:hypothetical protein